MRILLFTTLIITIAIAFMLIKVLLKRNGRFVSQHIHDSKPMNKLGIHCVMEQDREMRETNINSVIEHRN